MMIGRTTVSGCIAALLTTLILTANAATAAANPVVGGTDYVSDGDSYVAAGSYWGTSVSTSTSQTDCRQASDDIGHLVWRSLPAGTTFADWACAGAETSDITSGARGMGPQIAALSPATKYVSISIGGNDNGVFAAAKTCLVTGCPAPARAAITTILSHLPAMLDRTYSALRTAAPHARIVAVSYLRILPYDARGCFISILGGDTLTFLTSVEQQLHTIIHSAANRAGFDFIDTWPANGDRDRSVCAPDGQRWVSLTGIGPQDWGTAIHPTLAGRRHSAELIAKEFATNER